MTCLRFMYYVDELYRMYIATRVLSRQPARLIRLRNTSASSPEVSLVDVVIIGDAHAWQVTRQFTQRPIKAIPLIKVVFSQFVKVAVINGVDITFIKLVASEIQHIDFL